MARLILPRCEHAVLALAAGLLTVAACSETPTEPPGVPSGGHLRSSAAQTVIIAPAAMNGWGFLNEPVGATATGELAPGPGSPPLGDGSARLVTPAAGDGIVIGTLAYAGTRLDTIDDLAYSTYRTAGGPAQAIALQFNIDTDLTDANVAWQGRLVYEPYYTHAVATGAWQTWDPRDDAGGGNWWFTGAPGNAVCPISSPCTWSEVLVAFPDAGVRDDGGGALLFKAGSGWAGFDGNVDAFTISVGGDATTFDFEPYLACSFTTSGTTMTLDADCTTDETIFVPDGFTLDGDGHTITAIDPPGGHFLGAVVRNQGTVAHVTDLAITTDGLGDDCNPSAPIDQRLRGILFESANGTITNNTVSDINKGESGCQEGNAIEVRNAPFDGTHPGTKTVTISENSVDDYQKTGIVVNGDVSATVTDNTLNGLSPVPFIAQNGIQFGYGATGTIRQNIIDGNWYTGANWTSAGILLFQASGIQVRENTVAGSQTGIGVETWCYLAGPASASENQVMKNSVSGAQYGITIAAYDFYSSCDPVAANNKVTNNTLDDPESDGEIGVFVGTWDYFPTNSLTPTALNNKVINNAITGYEYPVDLTGASGSKVQANTPSAP